MDINDIKINKSAETKRNKLTKKEKGFADDYIETGNGTKAALNNYDTDDENVAAVIASQNLRKLKIKDYLESISKDAASRIEELSKTAKNENVRLNANKDILDRGIGKAPQVIAGDKDNPIVIEGINIIQPDGNKYQANNKTE